jgi:BlaI family transcriptional regulator, penicillinase repressor
MPRPRSQTPTPAELEVLEVLWRSGKPCTVRQVLEELNRKRPRAYTSVMSLLNVMTDKGLLKRKPQGRAFIYEPRAKQQPTRGKMVGDLVQRAFGGSVRQLMASALEQTDPSPEELDEIRRLIDEYRFREENPS